MSDVYLGIDLGTSAVKAVLVDEEQRVLAQESASLDVQRPRPLWSEQDPEAWWRATRALLRGLRARHPRELSAVQGIGLSGQMHGATLLDASDRVLRPAILWNDGRAAQACAELERRAPQIQEITGNLVMPGFTAPKLLWVAEHEPAIFARVARVLLPKDYLRLRLSGERASDMSDAAGTLWLDVARRAWSEPLLEATGLGRTAMPALFEGSAPTGMLRDELANEWGMGQGVVIAGGAGDQAAGAAGAGVVEPGQALLALGTSGVLFVAGDRFAPNPKGAVHAFCHCLPGRWHQMSVILSAASCLAWVTRLSGARDEAALLAEIEAADRVPDALLFLPYLSGERTPHNDPCAKGVFFGLTHQSERADLGRAVLEGVAFALADGQAALLAAGARIERVSVVGGGARSAFWGRILAAALDRPLCYAAEAELGPAFGAARLARLARTGENPKQVCVAPVPDRVVEPEPGLRDRYAERLAAYRRLYGALRERFAEGA
jgi:xylulokinase